VSLKSIGFVGALIAIPILFTIILFVLLEGVLEYKAQEVGIFFKFNNERVVKLREINPGRIHYENILPENEIVLVGVDNEGFLLPLTKHKKSGLVKPPKLGPRTFGVFPV
jgi:hypothetical protein